MVRTVFLVLIAAVLPVLPVGATTPLTVGTGTISGVYYLAGGAVCRLVNRERVKTGFRCIVEATGGSVANVRALAARDLDFAIVQSDVAYRALRREPPFEDIDATALQAVMHLHDEALTIAARPEPGLDFLTDFRGRRLNIGNPGSGTPVTMNLLAGAAGIDATGFAALTQLDPANHGRALCDGEIDGFAFQVGHPSENIDAAATLCRIRLLSLRPEAVAALSRQMPFFRPVTIPGGLYPNNPDDVTTLGVTAQLVTRAGVGDESVRALIDAVLDNATEFAALHPVLNKLKPSALATRSRFLPFHPAAAAAFRQRRLLE